MKKVQSVLNITTVEKPKSVNEYDFYQFFKEKLKAGTIDPIKVFFFLRTYTKCAELLNKDAECKEIINNALQKHDKQSLYGFNVTVSYRKDYDYIGTGSEHYLKLKEQQKAINEEVKKYEEFLEKLDDETTNSKEEGVILKPITFKSTRIITINHPKKKAA